MGSETTEQTHAHVCPVCDDTWLHACRECEPVYPGRTRPSYARCPEHEGVEG